MSNNRTEPDPIWAILQMQGWDGYERMEKARACGWEAITSWGLEGWDLGDPPYVVVFTRGIEELAINVEGDIEQYRFGLEAARSRKVDEIARFYWNSRREPWLSDGTPDEALRGAFSWPRLARERAAL